MPATIASEYVIHGFPRSLFTRKLQAAFVFYALPHRIEPRGIGSGDERRAVEAWLERAGLRCFLP